MILNPANVYALQCTKSTKYKIQELLFDAFALFLSAIVILGIASIFIGCAAQYKPEISFAPPAYVEQIPSREEEEDFGNPGSIFGAGQNTLFSDRRAMQLNDIVTVIINQTAQATSTAAKATNKNSNATLGGPSLNYGGNLGGMNNIANNVNNFTNWGITLGNSNSTYNGNGTQNRQETFTTTIAARIIKVLQNGNYFIEGSREVLINDEKQMIRVSGVVRPTDIARNNTIESQYIADAKILYDTQGDLKRSTEKGWGTRMIEAIWPF